MATLEELLVQIDATTEGLRRELRRGTKATQRFERRVGRSIGNVEKAFAKLRNVVGAAGIPVGVAAIGSAIGRVVADTAALAETADKLGLTVEQLQELRFAAEQTGVKTNTLDLAMQRFTRRVGEARKGSGELKDTLRQYNIALVDSNGNTRSSVDILGDLADAIAGAGDDSERLRIAFKAFDSEGAALVNTLREGQAGLDAYRRKAREVGAVLSDEAAEGAREFDARLKELSATMETTGKEAFFGFLNWVRERGNKRFGIDPEQEAEAIKSALQSELEEEQSKLARMRKAQEKAYAVSERDGKQWSKSMQAEMAAVEQKIFALREALGLIPPLPKPRPTPAAGTRELSDEDRAELASLADTIDQRLVAAEQRATAEGALLIQQQQEAAAVFAATRTPLEQYGTEMERLGRLLEAGVISQETYGRAASEAGNSILQQIVPVQSLADNLTGILLKTQSAGDALKNLAAEILPKLIKQMITAAIQGKALSSVLGGFGGGGGGGGFGKLFGFAEGGRPAVRRPAIVGEKGPELFVPDVAGMIVPNRDLRRAATASAAGGSMSRAVKIDVGFSLSGVPGAVRQELAAQLPALKQEMLTAVEDASTRGGKFAKSIRGRRF